MRTVVDSDYVFLDITVQDGLPALGLLRSDTYNPTSAAANADRYDLDDVVLRVGDNAKQMLPGDDTENATSWRKLGPAGGDVWVTNRDELEVAGVPVTGVNRRGIATSQLKTTSTNVDLRLREFTGPGTALQTNNKAWEDTVYSNALDSRVLDGSKAISGRGNTQAGTRWYFTRPGVYCLGFQASTTLKNATDPVMSQVGTLRIAVGDVAHPETAPCDDTNVDDWEPPAEGNPMDPATNRLLKNVHADVGPYWTKDGQFRVGLGTGLGTHTFHDFANTIVHVGDLARRTVPEVSATHDYTFVAPAGDTIWELPADQNPALPWLGYSTEDIGLTSLQRLVTWKLNGVSGIDGGAAPGDFVLGAWGGDLTYAGGTPYFSTRQGMPQAFQLGRNTHNHVSWDFTASGVYCLDMTMSSRRPDGTPVSDRQVMTVVVGGESLNPTTMQSCIQAGISADGTPAVNPITVPDPDEPVVVATDAHHTFSTALAPAISNGALGVDLVVGNQRGAGTAHNPDDVVIQVGSPGDPGTTADANSPWRATAGEQYWTLGNPKRLGKIGLGWDLLGIGANEMTGDLNWRLKEVRGGEMVVHDTDSVRAGAAILSNRPGYEAATYSLWPQTAIDTGTWTFKKTGVYCVSLEWAGKAADGTDLTPVTKTLTFAVAVDASQVIPCTWDGGGQTPGDPDPGGFDPGVEAPLDWTSVPASGRHVLDDGHVDLHSLLTATEHTVSVHDDNTVPATERQTDEVTLYVPPEVKNAIPATGYGFLGEVGAPVWMLPQTQVDGVVWPGWNVTKTATTATGVTWTLDAARGPGEFALYQDGEFGQPVVRLDSDDPTHASFGFDSHGHGNWAFTAEGVYCLDLTVSRVPQAEGFDRDVTLLFGVGQVDPSRVSPEECGKTPEQITESEKPTETPDALSEDTLTEAARGDVNVIPDAIAPGESGYVDIGDNHAGEWVYAWSYPGAAPLGWHRASTTGAIKITVPPGTEIGPARIAVVHRDGALLGWDNLIIGTSASEPMPLRPVVLDQGHVDLFELTYDKASEQLDLQVKDDTELYDLDASYRDPEKVTVAVDQQLAAFHLEEDVPGYEFLGPAGRETYMLDWNQQEALPWPGWSTERFVASLPDGVEVAHEQGKIELGVDVQGPGDVFAFIPGDNGPENKFIDTTDDQPDVIETGPDTHYHTTWVFTEPGDYELSVTPSATTTTGDTLDGPAKSYHFHVGPRLDLPTRVEGEEFGASIGGVPATVGPDTEVDLALQLDQPHPEVAGYQWYRWIDGQSDVKIAGATSPQVTTTVDPWDMVYLALLDDSGRVLSVVYAYFLPDPSAPGAPPNPAAWVEPSGKEVTLSWGTPSNGNSPLTGYVATLTSTTGTVLTKEVTDPDAYQVTFTDVPAGTWTGKVRAINAIGTGPDSEPSAPVTVTAPEPEPEPSDPDTEPVPEDQLTPATVGEIEVAGAGTPFTPGSEVTVHVGASHAGAWVSPWLHSRPVWLGWKQVDASGAIKLRLPDNAAEGAHRIVVKTRDGHLLGWDDMRVAKVPGSDPDPQPVATKITAATVTQTYGQTATLVVSVSPNATGQVTARAGTKTVSGALTNGRATLTLPAKVLKPGKQTVTIAYAGVAGTFQPTTANATVKVAKATPVIKVKRIKTTVRRGKTGTFHVTVSAAGVKPGGNVTVEIGGKKETVKLKAGKATVEIKLRRTTKAGEKTVKVSYSGDRYVAKGKASTKIGVTR